MSGKARFKSGRVRLNPRAGAVLGEAYTESQQKAADVNVNGIVDSSDSLLILQYTVHLFICIFEISVTMHSPGINLLVVLPKFSKIRHKSKRFTDCMIEGPACSITERKSTFSVYIAADDGRYEWSA